MEYQNQKYTCPMHPEIVEDAPGNCPLCGMKLVPIKIQDMQVSHVHHHGHAANAHDEGKVDHASHSHNHHDVGAHGHHEGMIQDFKKRFYVVLFLTVPIMLLSPMIQHWLGVNWSFTGSTFILAALSTIVYCYGGWPFLTGLKDEIKGKNPGMMTLVGLAVTVAYAYSMAIVFGLAGMDFFWELATLILIMLLGHWIEMKSIVSASREMELLVKLMPSEAHLVVGESMQDVKTEILKTGDVILIKPGEKIAADGVIIDGKSYVNESMLTGESRPVERVKNDNVIAGAINGEGSLKIRVSHSSKDSYLAQVIKLVRDAQNAKSNTQLLADRAAKWLTLIAIASGILTFVVWFALEKNLAFAMERMVTVIVTCCPHALGLAVPLVVARSTVMSAQSGLLIKNRTAFENSRKITTLVFDKTGTLTLGKFNVVRHDSLLEKYSANEILKYAAALEENSEHPIATGIKLKATELNLKIPAVTKFKAITGKGIEGHVDDHAILVVSPGYLKENNLSTNVSSSSEAETIVFVLIDNVVAGYIGLADAIRPESADAIVRLKAQGIKTLLLTGDNKDVAKAVSDAVKLDGFIAEVLPHQKLDAIKALQDKGEFVAMAGDGVNDAPALAQANIGIAVGSGSDIAAETAGIVLVNSNPNDIADLIRFGKATYKKMIQNLVWATGYNVVALPLAAGVLYKEGIILSPAMGAVLMTVSTVVVAVNARLLEK